MVTDFDERPYGQDQDYREGMMVNDQFVPNIKLIKAIAKTLIQKGVCTKAELVANL